MGYGGMFYFIPLWAVYVGTVAMILICLELGYRFSKIKGKGTGEFNVSTLGSMVGATLGLLAFILALSFGAGITRFQAKKQAMLDEVNAIGTTYLRTEFLSGEAERQSKLLLSEYVTVRLDSAVTRNLPYILKRSDEIHDELWAIAMASRRDSIPPPYVASYISSLNEMIDIHLIRLTAGARSAIPGIIWITLYAIMCVCMITIGYEAGIGGAYKSLVVLALAFVFATVIYIIADLERPTQGQVQMDVAPLIEQKAAFQEDVAEFQ